MLLIMRNRHNNNLLHYLKITRKTLYSRIHNGARISTYESSFQY